MKERSFASSNNRYQFNNKQYDDETETSDFGARILDGDLAIWNAIDKMWDKYPEATPYNYAMNAPILFKDVDGNDIYPSALLKNTELLRQGLKLFNETTEGQRIISLFVRAGNTTEKQFYKQVGINGSTSGILKDHELHLKIDNRKDPSDFGEFSLSIKNEGDKNFSSVAGLDDLKGLDKNTTFQFNITLFAQQFASKSGQAMTYSHEFILHANVIIDALAKFEQARTDLQQGKDGVTQETVDLAFDDLKKVLTTVYKDKKATAKSQHAAMNTNEKLKTAYDQIKAIVAKLPKGQKKTEEEYIKKNEEQDKKEQENATKK
jgi:RHS repeat-associated protein